MHRIEPPHILMFEVSLLGKVWNSSSVEHEKLLYVGDIIPLSIQPALCGTVCTTMYYSRNFKGLPRLFSPPA